MTLDTQDKLREKDGLGMSNKPDANATHVFHTMEQIGISGSSSDWKQRAMSIAVAVLICVALYGMLYLAMHYQE